MNNQAPSKSSKKDRSAAAHCVVWFEIPADDLERANRFYGALFGWKIEPAPGRKDAWHIDTGGGKEVLDGGLVTRCHPQQTMTVYVDVESVSDSMVKVEKLGGKVCAPKMAVPGRGYFAICQDTEKNVFALWERDENAK